MPGAFLNLFSAAWFSKYLVGPPLMLMLDPNVDAEKTPSLLCAFMRHAYHAAGTRAYLHGCVKNVSCNM